MKCPHCNHPDSQVVDSRQYKTVRRRRRECQKCGRRFSTTEVLGTRADFPPLFAPKVVKKNGALEEFDAKKLYNSIALSVRKQNRDAVETQKFVDDMAQESAGLDANISTAELGRRVLEWLRRNDKMGYLRYASVHEELNSPEDFARLLARLKNPRPKDKP